MKSFEELRDLVASVTKAGGPALYRDLYGMEAGAPPLVLDSPAAWSVLPLLEKSDLQKILPADRAFVSWRDVDAIYATSGTSGKPPLFIPRTKLDLFGYRAAWHAHSRAFLSSVGPPHRQEYYFASRGQAPRVVGLDQRNVRASIRLAKAAGVDGMYLFAFLVPGVAECMREFQMTDGIRFIEITGETCSDALYTYTRAAFPNATIVGSLGANEVEDSPHGIPCTAALCGADARRFHIKDDCHVEIIDAENGAPVAARAGAEGEMVLTVGGGAPYASPLIRYRTKDIARIEEESCPLHGAWTFSIAGRIDADFLKLPHGQLRADEIERVLRSLSPEVTDEFEAIRSEVPSAAGPHVQVILRVRAFPGADLDRLAERIAEQLRTGPSTTYADNVRRGRCAPLVCEPLPDTATPAGKRRKMTSA